MNESFNEVLSKRQQELIRELEAIDTLLGRKAYDTAKSNGNGKRNVPKTCIVPGCSKPSNGPRYSYACKDHRGLSKAKRAKYYQQWKAKNA